MSTIVDHQITAMARSHRMIEPFNPKQVNPASYDVRIGSHIDIEGTTIGPEEYRQRWRRISLENSIYYLQPGEFVLAVLQEYIRIPNSMEAVFQLKSSRGREGYEHALAAYADPGYHGCMTLELSNINRRHKIPLQKGMLIGQLRFMKLDAMPEQSYSETGHYHGDTTVQPSRVSIDLEITDWPQGGVTK
jgi:dCTP deaminase